MGQDILTYLFFLTEHTKKNIIFRPMHEKVIFFSGSDSAIFYLCVSLTALVCPHICEVGFSISDADRFSNKCPNS